MGSLPDSSPAMSRMAPPVIAWFRRNLRLVDNPALVAAIETGQPVLPVYVRDENDAGGASDWWLHHSLEALATDLDSLGTPLLMFAGPAGEILPRIVSISGASRLFLPGGYSALALAEEDAVRDNVDIDTCVVDDYYLHKPGTVLTNEGTPYKVFTPFWKSCLGLGEPARPLPAPDAVATCGENLLERLRRELPACTLADFALLPQSPDWAGGLRDTWRPGENGAHRRLEEFRDDVARYARERDRPDLDSTSRLSPHLHFGEISARQVWHSINDLAEETGGSDGAQAFLRQLYWREFSGHLLYHFPELPAVPLRSEFDHFPWKTDDAALRAWQRGRTGYPIVDAGMRQLWTTGWMHNRLRMVVASFLVKNLMIPWQSGAEWFLDTLVDADLANNSASWQWVAGCGTDAAPYFRIYNPTLQSRKFDPEGHFIRRWIPEIAGLPDEDLHEPWEADGMTQRLANVSIGDDYPQPIVDLARSRDRALDAYHELRSLIQSPAASPGSSAG